MPESLVKLGRLLPKVLALDMPELSYLSDRIYDELAKRRDEEAKKQLSTGQPS